MFGTVTYTVTDVVIPRRAIHAIALAMRRFRPSIRPEFEVKTNVSTIAYCTPKSAVAQSECHNEFRPPRICAPSWAFAARLANKAWDRTGTIDSRLIRPQVWSPQAQSAVITIPPREGGNPGFPSAALSTSHRLNSWVPAFAGMTKGGHRQRSATQKIKGPAGCPAGPVRSQEEPGERARRGPVNRPPRGSIVVGPLAVLGDVEALVLDIGRRTEPE